MGGTATIAEAIESKLMLQPKTGRNGNLNNLAQKGFEECIISGARTKTGKILNTRARNYCFLANWAQQIGKNL